MGDDPLLGNKEQIQGHIGVLHPHDHRLRRLEVKEHTVLRRNQASKHKPHVSCLWGIRRFNGDGHFVGDVKSGILGLGRVTSKAY